LGTGGRRQEKKRSRGSRGRREAGEVKKKQYIPF
jgi:hypothetical protein